MDFRWGAKAPFALARPYEVVPMKLSSLALVAWMLLAQIALADDAGSTIALPPGSRISPAAQNAAEAPRWNQSPAPATAAPTANPVAPSAATIAPGTAQTPAPAPGATAGLPKSVPGPAPTPAATQQPVAAQPPQQLPPSDDAKPLAPATADNSPVQPDNSDAATDQPRPLYSVMVRHTPKTPAASSAEPASDAAPAVTPARYEEPLPSPPMTTVPPASTSATETPLDPEKVAAARATAGVIGSSFETHLERMTPITLLEALNQAGETRLAAIQDYWRLWHSWADYHWAQDELHRLEQVVPARGAVDAPMLSTARAAAAARVHEAKAGIQVTQDALMRSAHLAILNDPYRPGDPPLVGPYHTYFAQLFGNRQPPGHTLQIERSLPLRLKAINDRTAAVSSALTAIHTAEEAHAKGEADMRTVLACHDDLYRQRRALLDEVLRYNLEIGDYASTVAAPGTPNEKMVAMLIEPGPSDHTPSAPATTSSPARNSSTAGVRANPNDGWVPSTMRSIERAPR
jgi:hypothetical protein